MQRRHHATALAILLLSTPAALAQGIDLSHGGPVTVTAAGGIDWDQNAQTVTARQDAKAVRGTVTVTADDLVAHYRKKAVPPGKPGAGTSATTAATATPTAAAATPAVATAKPAAATATPATTTPATTTPAAPGATASATKPILPGSPDDTGSSEIYRLEAIDNVHIFTPTDQAWGDHAIYDLDRAVLVLTGRALKLVTPTDTLTARDAMEYWSARHMSVGRGDAVVVTNDGKRVQADVLVGYSDPDTTQPGAAKPGAPPKAQTVSADAPGKPAKTDANADPIASSGKLKRVDAFGHVQVRTLTEVVTGDRGVYIPDTGIARIVGHVHITRGQNQLNGAAAIVNMKTGVATLSEMPGARVQGLIVPNDANAAAGKPDATGAKAGVQTGVQAGAQAGVQAGAKPNTNTREATP